MVGLALRNFGDQRVCAVVSKALRPRHFALDRFDVGNGGDGATRTEDALRLHTLACSERTDSLCPMH
jgi:hypothetical protein